MSRLKRSSLAIDFLRRIVERVEHVEDQFDASGAAERNVFETRRSSSVCDDSRRVPRGSSRTRC